MTIVLEARGGVFYVGEAALPMPQFHVRDAFAIHDKNLFVLAGFVVEGKLADGMFVRLPFNPAVQVTAPIDHVQQLRRPHGEITCLCIRCTDPQEAKLWEAFKIKGRMIDIIDVPA